MIYWDMDGVLFKYDYNIYAEDRIPKWNELGAHTFRHLPRDDYAHSIFSEIAKVMPSDQWVLTSVFNLSAAVKNEQIIDKLLELSEEYSEFDLCNFIACASEKRNVITKIKGFKLTKADILIDDYNNNLFAWLAAGGTAIKYLNGINSKGIWPGPTIGIHSKVDIDVAKILDIFYKASVA